MRAPWVPRQISYLHSISVHMLLSKPRVSVATAGSILTSSHGNVVANDGRYTTSLMHTQKKENQGEQSQANDVAK
jgi:hypothetical protein